VRGGKSDWAPARRHAGAKEAARGVTAGHGARRRTAARADRRQSDCCCCEPVRRCDRRKPRGERAGCPAAQPPVGAGIAGLPGMLRIKDLSLVSLRRTSLPVAGN